MLNENSFRNAGLRVGRLFGIDIWIHWILLLFLAIRLIEFFLADERITATPVLGWLCLTLVWIGSVLLHELGHAWAAKRQDGHTERIILWPLGGLAYCEAPQTPWSQFWVSAGGPLVTLALALIGGIVCLVAGWQLSPWNDSAPAEGLTLYARLFFQYFATMNFVLFLANLLPCWPIDGGKMLHCLLWHRTGSHPGSMLLTLNVSRVVAIVALVFSGVLIVCHFAWKHFTYDHPVLALLGTFCLIVGVLHFVEAHRLRQELRYGEGPGDDVFGYDFSKGYTSLERGFSGRQHSDEDEQRPGWLEHRRSEKRRREEERRVREESELRARLDELLEKIHRYGMESLSREEQRFLDKASKHVRDTKQVRESAAPDD